MLRLFLVLSLLLATRGYGVTDALRATEVSLTIMVPDEDKAGDQLAEAAEKLGGYFKDRSQHRIVVRVPQEQLESYLGTAAGLGKVAERQYEARDITAERAELAAGLASREEMLKRYLANLGETSNHADLGAITAATGELVGEIERAKGGLQLLDHKSRFASVDVSFRVRERRAVKVRHASSFRWLSSLDMNELMADFARPEELP